MVAPELQKVASRQAGRALVVKINTDELADLGQRAGVRSIPTLAIIAGGKELASPQLYLPVNQPVDFTIQSKDVLHDFWVPAFRIKKDAVPGINVSYRVTTTRIPAMIRQLLQRPDLPKPVADRLEKMLEGLTDEDFRDLKPDQLLDLIRNEYGSG